MTTAQLAAQISGTPRGFAPDDILAHAGRSLLNWMGVAIGAAKHPMVDMALTLALQRGTNDQATVLGRDGKVDIVTAALINGMSSHIFDYDDTFLDTILHPSAPVLPAALAWGEWQGASGRELLEATVIGIEVAQRAAQMVYPSHYDRGWHITGSVGGLGAAAAAGWLMGLDQRPMTMALGLAAAQPVGLREMFGTYTKPFHPGKAAANGLEAAMLAGLGFTSSMRALEAPRGFAHVTSDAPDFSRLTDGWGQDWQIRDNSYKPFPCGVVIHPIIDGAVRLVRDHGISAADVERLRMRVHPLVLELTGKKEPKDDLEAKFSVYHCAAAALLDGWVGLAQFAPARVTAPDVVELRGRVVAEVDGSLAEDQVHMTAELKDGREVVVWVEHCLGSKDNPMTDELLQRKFADVTAGVISEGSCFGLIEVVRHLAAVPDLSELVALSAPIATAGRDG